MSRGINKVLLIGNVCNDADVRYLPNGGAVANITLATNESWLDKNSGQKQEKAEFHRVVFFGKLADVVAQYVKKGSKLYVEGKLQTRKWQDQAGNDKYTTEIVVDGFSGQMQMLDSAGGNNNPVQQPQQPQQTQGGYQHPNYHQSAPQQHRQAVQPSPMANNPTDYNQQQAQNYQQAQANHAQQQQNHQTPAGVEPIDDFDDDIPF